MRDILFTFQEDAKEALQSKINRAHMYWSENEPQVISFSAPTGAGKTIIMTSLFEDIFTGTADVIADPDSIFVWLSDSPELNAQTRLKIESKSDKLRAQDLVTIESTFDAEELECGHIYFLNTQKLGSDKLLISKRDKRSYTIWETLTNTARHRPKQLYIVIDEAHRGTAQSTQEANKAQSIMQKFIKGSEEDGLCIMPLVIGVTATPEKFNRLVEGTTSTVQKVPISSDKVRESGLLKDRIILGIPNTPVSADMSTFGNAIDNWMEKCAHWATYYDPAKQED
ncbi:MAG TPA: DEAD/DEAH box helicase family protein, partial [Saccharofermentans sp.]|nr:DEAD/DEAH box helicase family protein [Saccharofermentans sp.]